MAYGKREKRTEKSRKSATKINKDVEISKLKYEEPEQTVFYCVACGKSFTKQATNFLKTQSPLFAGNNGYAPICKKCIEKYYKNLVDFFSGNEEKAMDRCASLLDLYYNDKIFTDTGKISADRSRVLAYPSKANLPQYHAKGKTYVDTIADRANNIIESPDDIDKIKEEGRSNITKTMFERWGQVSPEDIVALEEHYKMLKKQNPNCDNNQEIFIKDLCYIKILQMKAFRDNSSSDFEKHTKLYRETFKQSGLKIVQEDDGSGDNTIGINAELISQYTPEEFYKDKKLYKDFDGLGEYFERFVTRPLKNLQFGDNKRDPEYNIGDTDENID